MAPAGGFRRGLASPVCNEDLPERNADSAKECSGETRKVELHYPDEPKEGIGLRPWHKGTYVGMHDAIQKRMRQAAGETTQEYSERREFTSCSGSGTHEWRDTSQEAGPRGADDDEAQDGR
jgi:hypothetical protein